MIGRILRWNRLVFPPWRAIAAFLFVYLFNESVRLYVVWRYDASGDMEQFLRVRWAIVGAAAVLFVLFRISFHPAYRPGYREWLECTPWTAAQPLPLGPVHLLPQDAIIVALLLLLMQTTGMELAFAVFAFLLAYELAVTGTLLLIGERWLAYGLLFCLSFAVWFVQAAVLGMAVLVLIYPVAYRAHLKSLAGFPWHGKGRFVLEALGLSPRSQKPMPQGSQQLGFPFQYLSPKPEVHGISLAEGTALSLLAGAWAHALVVNGLDVEAQSAIAFLFCLFPLGIAAATRLVLYGVNYWPPISFFGRIATGRWVIPRYDRVFVAPLLALAVLATGSLRFLRTGTNLEWGMPFVLAIGLWLNLNLGPGLLAWRLTRGHRLVPGPRNRQTHVEA